MAIVAGIDEAGLGPVLGPLVVSASIFELPDELADLSMWKLLAGAVCKKPSRRRGLVAIADSKKLYSGLRGSVGLENLERGVLAMLFSAGRRAGSLRELMDVIAPGGWHRSQAEPWFAGGDLPLPYEIDATSAVLCGNSLADRMSKVGLKLLALRCEPVFTGEFNRLVQTVNNKSSMLFDVVSRLLVDVWSRLGPAGRGRINVDHQGGRIHYLPALQRLFDGCRFKVLEEAEGLSAYRLCDDSRQCDIVFSVQAEDTHLPVALASMVSKYVRELFMVLFNRFWTLKMPGLEPTAGYYSDGKRFYEQIEPLARQLGMDESVVLRCR